MSSETALALVERYKCTNSHMVPTQFKRMPSLSDDVKAKYDLRSMRWLIHAAAPCPIGIKKVADVAVFGVPDEDWGQQIKAVVQPAADVKPGDELAAEILAGLEGRLAKMKWPRSIDFTAELPRDPSGKLLERRLRDRTGPTMSPGSSRERGAGADQLARQPPPPAA